MKIAQTLFAAVAFISAASATHAAIVDLGNITRDTASGLDWLDVTQTQGLSYNQVLAQMGAGGAFAGWRYATVGEFDQLITNFGYPVSTGNCSNSTTHCDLNIPGDSPIIEQIIRTLGDTQNAYLDATHSTIDISPTGAGFVTGYLSINSFLFPSSTLKQGSVGDSETIIRATGQYNADALDIVLSNGTTSFNLDYTEARKGSFLVKVSPVPIPAAAWLFGSGLIGLAGLARKRSSNA